MRATEAIPGVVYDCGLHETVVRLVTEWKKVKNDG